MPKLLLLLYLSAIASLSNAGICWSAIEANTPGITKNLAKLVGHAVETAVSDDELFLGFGSDTSDDTSDDDTDDSDDSDGDSGSETLDTLTDLMNGITNLCTPCNMTCTFIKELDKDLQAADDLINCLGDLYDVFKDASEMLDSWGLDFFADWDFWGDFHNAFTTCEAAVTAIEQAIDQYENTGGDNADDGFYQIYQTADPDIDRPEFSDEPESERESNEQWMIAGTEQYMQELSQPQEYGASSLLCITFDQSALSTGSMDVYENTHCNLEELATGEWICAYYAQCPNEEDLANFFSSTNPPNCQFNIVYANGDKNAQSSQVKSLNGCPILSNV